MYPSRCTAQRSGFTILELAGVILIIAILATLSVPVISKLRARAQRAQCTTNVRGLYVAANLYLQDHGSWPQIRRTGSGDDEYANRWIDALAPFNIQRKHWICPTIQNALQNPDYSSPESVRLDYMATPFDDKPGTPHRWPRQPWFVETGDVHGNGNLIIFTDGSLSDLKSVIGSAPSGR